MDELNGQQLGKISATMEFLKRDMGEVRQDLKNVPAQISESHGKLMANIRELSDSLERHYVSQEEFQPVKENHATKEELKTIKDRLDTISKNGGLLIGAILLTIVAAILRLIIK